MYHNTSGYLSKGILHINGTSSVRTVTIYLNQLSDIMAHAPSRKSEKFASDRVRLSKSLSWLLRHGVNKAGLSLQPGGFLYLSDVMKLPQFSQYTIDDVRMVVDNCEKKRFALATDSDNGQLKIRANQGHSIEVDELELTPIADSTEAPTVVHGTNMNAWRLIKSQGLRKMRRNHIHFAVGEPGADGVISGMRNSSEVMIYLDVDMALTAGVPLLRSANNVLLSPGLEDGVIPPTLFSKVVHRPTGQELPLGPQDSSCAGIDGAGVVTADDLADEMEKASKKNRKKKNKHKNLE